MSHKRKGRQARQERRRRADARPHVEVVVPRRWRDRWDKHSPGCLVVAANYIVGEVAEHVKEIIRMLDGMTPDQFERLMYEAERRGLVQRGKAGADCGSKDMRNMRVVDPRGGKARRLSV